VEAWEAGAELEDINSLFLLVDHAKAILCENNFNLKTISQGGFGNFRDNNLIILSNVAKIALRDCF